jgi:hypothetical protein
MSLNPPVYHASHGYRPLHLDQIASLEAANGCDSGHSLKCQHALVIPLQTDNMIRVFYLSSKQWVKNRENQGPVVVKTGGI